MSDSVFYFEGCGTLSVEGLTPKDWVLKEKFSKERMIAVLGAERDSALRERSIVDMCLMVDQIPCGTLPRYEAEKGHTYVLVGEGGFGGAFDIDAIENGKVELSRIDKAAEFLVPSYEIQGHSREEIARKEEKLFVSMLERCCLDEHKVTCVGDSIMTGMNQAFSVIESRDLTVAKIVAHPSFIRRLREWEIRESGLGKASCIDWQGHLIVYPIVGCLWTAEIVKSSMVPEDTAYLMAPCEYVGVKAVRQGFTTLKTEDGPPVCYEEVGFAIVNDYAISKISMVTQEEMNRRVDKHYQVDPKSLILPLQRLAVSLQGQVSFGNDPAAVASQQALLDSAFNGNPELRAAFANVKILLNYDKEHVIVLVCTPDGKKGLLEVCGWDVSKVAKHYILEETPWPAKFAFKLPEAKKSVDLPNNVALVDEERSALVSKILSTEEGQIAVANAMAEPVRKYMDYAGIGRELMMVDKLPQGALAAYERDVNAVCTIVPRGGFSGSVGYSIGATGVTGGIGPTVTGFSGCSGTSCPVGIPGPSGHEGTPGPVGVGGKANLLEFFCYETIGYGKCDVAALSGLGDGLMLKVEGEGQWIVDMPGAGTLYNTDPNSLGYGQLNDDATEDQPKERPATAEDIADVQRQLAEVANDPNLTITGHFVDYCKSGECSPKDDLRQAYIDACANYTTTTGYFDPIVTKKEN